jgi:hypothetical protein
MGYVPDDFDTVALYGALDARRQADRLSWRQVADQIWQQSADLNDRRRDHPISPSTITGMAARRPPTAWPLAGQILIYRSIFLGWQHSMEVYDAEGYS